MVGECVTFGLAETLGVVGSGALSRYAGSVEARQSSRAFSLVVCSSC